MKKILTILLLNDSLSCEQPAETAEVIAVKEGNKALENALKQAKGRYTVFFASPFKCGDVNGLLEALDKINTDIVNFDGGYCFKTAVLKSVGQKCLDGFTLSAYGAFNSKSFTKIDSKPFTYTKEKTEYSEELENEIGTVIDEFSKCKAKLIKDIYNFAHDIILAKLADFYIAAMVAAYKKKIDYQKIKDFDLKLKANIVTYLTLEKKFTAENLAKLREKGFKIVPPSPILWGKL